MKINYSISLKLTLIVVLLSTVVIFSLAYFNIQEERKFFEETYFDKAHSLIEALDVGIVSYDGLNNSEKLLNYLTNFTDVNREIIKININMPSEQGLIVNISTDNESIGTIPNTLNQKSYENEDTFFIIEREPTNSLIAISPINISNKTVGTYEMTLSVEKGYSALDVQVKNIVIISFVSIIILILSFLYLLRRAIVKPIIAFRDAARLIGEGDLEAEIKITSRDELGELASAFNDMSTELKKSREKIEKYSKTLEKLLKQKDEFIGQLGHDLKNPLTPLIGLLPMIIEREENPKNKEQLQIIYNNVEYMKDLIYKTLELARLRSEKIKFDFENLNLQDEIEKVIKTQKLYLDENNIKIKNKVNKKIMVSADKLRLAELFNNLITNSVKYTSDDSGYITIDAKQDKKYVTISLKDTGIGMTKKEAEQIFDEFYKADQSRHDLDSSGLGLSICKRIVEKHDGRIWVESEGPGKGSTFYFTLKKAV